MAVAGQIEFISNGVELRMVCDLSLCAFDSGEGPVVHMRSQCLACVTMYGMLNVQFSPQTLSVTPAVWGSFASVEHCARYVNGV